MPSNFKVRTISAIVYAIVVFSCLFTTKYALIGFLSIVALFCVWEYVKITRLSITIALVLVLLIIALAVIRPDYLNQPAILLLSCLYLAFMLFKLLVKLDLPVHSSMRAITVALYILLPFALLILSLFNETVYALMLPYFLFIWTADVGAYLVGRRFGKTPLYPAISPKKTWEGFFGAGIAVIMVAIIFHLTGNGHTALFWILFGCIVWIFGAVGDLVESQLKREHSIKDSSNLIPGHGGFLDRFDGFLFAIPFYLLLLSTFDII